MKRSVSGYNLHKVIYENKDGRRVINLSKLLVGSEGTLGIVVEAKVRLVTLPEETLLAVYCFHNLIEALEAVSNALSFKPSAVELMDDEVFRLTRESEAYAQYVAPVPEDCEAALMLEFDSELHSGLEEVIKRTNHHFIEEGKAYHIIEAFSGEDQERLWKLRNAAIPLLMSLKGDPKPYPFVEDASVLPEDLAEYVRGFIDILKKHDTIAAFFGHAGGGTLHIRPILNLKKGKDVEKMRFIADNVTDLILKYHGSFSGEHGDGQTRTEFNPKMYGPELWEAFKTIKSTFDLNWIMNPGKVVYRDESPVDMRKNLRYGAEYSTIHPTTTLNFEESSGFTRLIELCNGCGTCRQSGTQIMCPTYRALKEEISAPRGRANMLRAVISGNMPVEEMYTERFKEEVLGQCLGCKGCMSDCPTGVDLTKLRAEVLHKYRKRNGSTMRSGIFRDIASIARLGSMTAPLSNWAIKIPGMRTIMESILGIARERSLPEFKRETLVKWFKGRVHI